MSNTKADQKEGSPKEQKKSRESSKTADDTKPKAEKTAERKTSPSQEEAQQPKKIVKKGVTGTVKWFNVVNRYGFISRNDVTGEDIFVHQTAIASYDPKKAVASLGDGEEVLFDVVEGENGPEASNVTGPNGDPVQGSKHAPEKSRGYRGRGRGFFRRGYRRSRGSGNHNSESGGDQEREGSVPQEDRPPRRGRGGFRRGGGFRFRRGGPRHSEGNDGGPPAGNDQPARRGRGRGRGRGQAPQDN